METSATLSNRGDLSAGNTLALKAGTIDNEAGGTIKGAQVELQATDAHTLTNRGLVDGNEVFFDTITLDNLGTGRIYGDHVAIAATTLNNWAEGASAPVIAARDRLDIGATTIDNRDGALLFSAGDMAIGGALDAGHQASGQAATLTNTSAAIEALGHLTLSVVDLSNQRREFAMARGLSTDLPQGLEMLAYNPALQFFWGIEETNPVNWRNFLRDRYIGSINGLLGGTLDAGYRAQLEALVNAQPRSVFEDSINIWNLLLGKINTDHPECVTTMAATLSSQSFPLRTYNQLCRDSECDYVHYLISERIDYNDVVTSSAPAAGILAGGNATITANHISNAYSLIEAGGDLVLTGDSLANSGAELYRQTDTITTTHILHWVDRDHGTSVSSDSSSSVIGTVPGIISAGGTLTGSFTDRIDNLTLRQGTAPLATPSGTTIVALDTGHGAPNPTGSSAAVAALAAAQNVTRIVEVQSLAGNPGGPALIRTVTPNTTLPSNALYHAAANPTANVLIETDPAFASYRQWLTSDYMLAALGIDPATNQKRLGDGFYEQRLISEQVGQLTGRRFLAGYSSDEAQYQALMDAGVSVAQAWAIRPGVALSAEQMAQLTSDIVLLVEKDIQLADGTTQKVLAPQVYARLQDGDLAPNGALLAANTIDLQVGGDLTTSGSIAGRQLVSLSAENLQNLRGRIAGQSVGVAARNDLTLDGGTISAQDRLIAAAGNNLTVKSSTADLEVRMSGTPNFVNSRVIDRVAGLYVSGPDALLVASAGNDLKILGGVVQNSGQTTAAGGGGSALVAGNNLTLGTVLEASNSYAQAKNSWRKEQSSNEVGSLIQTTGDVTLVAGNDLAARAASVASGGALTAQAGNDLSITAGEATYDMASYRKIKKSGFASSTTKINRDAEQSTSALSSLFSGERVTLAAGQDVLLRGSAVSAQGDLAISAARDITLDTAQDTLQETHFRSIKKSGFSMSSLGAISYGNSSLTQNAAGQSVTQVGSTLSGANVATLGGRDTTIRASTVIADDNLSILAGRNVDILAAANAQNVETRTKSSSTSIGLTPDLSGRITIFGKTKASEDVTGTAISQSTSLLSANAGDLTIRAGLDAQYKGSGQGNITTQGADLLAGQRLAMSANAIDLQAVANQSTSHSLAKTSSFTIGARPAGFWGEKIAAIGDAIERAQNTDNERLKDALVLKAGYDAWKISQGQKPPETVPTGTETTPGSGTTGAAAAPLKSNSGGSVPGADSGAASSGFGIQVYLGSSKSKSEMSTHERTVSGTNLQARTIDLAATETDLTLSAAKLQAENISLSAQRDILLQAAANTSDLTSRNSGSSTGLGVSFAFGGQQNGLSFQISASRMKGKADGSETIWDNTLVTASDTLSVSSGRDTSLKGAQVAGQTVLFDVGGKLLVETLQDNSLYASQQTSSGFNLSICWFFCAGTPVTGSIGASSQSIKHNYLSAVGQSGIAAGDGGFDIEVRGETELIGAALTSSAAAEKNRLTTASLTSRDLDNAQLTKASSSSISLAYGGDSGLTTLAGNATANLLANLNGNAALPKNGSEQSQTQSVISPATITLTGSGNAETDEASRETIALLTRRDPATANEPLTNTLSLQQAQVLEREIVRARENQEAAQLVGAVLANVVGDVAKNMQKPVIDAQTRQYLDDRQASGEALTIGERNELTHLEQAGMSSEKAALTLADPAALAAFDKWKDGSPAKLALHGMVGLIEAKIGNGSAAAGALGEMSQEAMVPIISDYLTQNGFAYGSDDYKALMQLGATLAGTAIGTLAGGTQGAASGASAAFVGMRNNYLYHYKGKIIAYDKNDNAKIIELSEEDLRKLAAQNPDILLQLIAGIDTQAAPILVLNTSSELMTGSRIFDLYSPVDNSQIAKEFDMGYKNLTDQETRIYVQTGMQNARSDADQSAIALSTLLGLPVGYINNGTQGLIGDVGEYLPESVSKKDALNEYTLRTLNSKGPTLIVTHSAGNEDVRKALQVGALYGHQYENLSFLSLGSPVSGGTLQTSIGQSGAQYLGQVNDWKDPVTYSKTAGVVSVGSFLGGLFGGLGYGAAQGCAVGAAGGPLGCLFAGVIGGAAGGAAGATPALAGYLGLKYYHPFEQYIAKPKTQSILFDWLNVNPSAPVAP